MARSIEDGGIPCPRRIGQLRSFALDNRLDGLPHGNEMRLLWFGNQAAKLGFEQKKWNTAMEADCDEGLGPGA